jgi:protocatechuate 3,4-dioxygenase beta subunit
MRKYIRCRHDRKGAQEKHVPPSVTAPDTSLSSALALNSLELAVQYPTLSFADSAAPTPECHDGDEATIRQTEGPYFKPSSPQRADLVEPNVKTQLVEITGQVLTRSCRPVERVLLDLWHADENGEYDMQAFAIADTSLPMPKVVTGSAPSYRRSRHAVASQSVGALSCKTISTAPKRANWTPLAFVIDTLLVRTADYAVGHCNRQHLTFFDKF